MGEATEGWAPPDVTPQAQLRLETARALADRDRERAMKEMAQEHLSLKCKQYIAEREAHEGTRALVRELVEALREIDEMPDEEPAGWSPTAHGADWISYTRARQQAIARSALTKARASGYTEEGE